jgi:hypothetical protein
VEPLRGDVELHAAVGARVCEPGLGPERRLVLHCEGVFAFDDDLRASVWISVHDAHFLDDVAVFV